MQLIKSATDLVEGKKYVCGQLHPTDSSWEVWNIMEWDAEDKVLYCGDLFEEGTPFSDFKFVYELPSLK